MRRGLVPIVLGAIVLTGCGGEETAPPSASQSVLAGTTLDGEQVSLEDFRGTPLFVNVWSSW